MIRKPAVSCSVLRHAPAPSEFASRAIAIVAALLLGTALLVSTAAAQEVSPTAGEVVDSTECLIEPLTDDDLLGIAATPPGGESTPAPDVAGSPAAFTEPEGEPASDAEVEAVTMTARELVACLNAADYRRVSALYTEGYLARSFAGRPRERVLATPAPAESVTENALVAVDDVIVLPDGRLGARIELATGSEAQPVLLYSVFAQVEERWLIDEETAIEAAGSGEATPGSATPTS